MNLGIKESVRLAKSVAVGIKKGKIGGEVAIFPDFISLSLVAKELKQSNISFGAQDCALSDHGAHTGEVAAESIKELGSKYVIVGHSERRAAGETDIEVKQKAEMAVASKLCPIICVGEPKYVRDAGKAISYVTKQLKSAISSKLGNNFVIAYEPIWAIGTGVSPDPETIVAMHKKIKETVLKLTGKRIRVIYGGSVSEKNAASFVGQKDIDGLLIGGASLKAKSFISICVQSK